MMIGSFFIFQGKNRLEKKLFLKQGYKHLLFRGETIDKKVVKKDIVDVKVSLGWFRSNLLISTEMTTK